MHMLIQKKKINCDPPHKKVPLGAKLNYGSDYLSGNGTQF